MCKSVCPLYFFPSWPDEDTFFACAVVYIRRARIAITMLFIIIARQTRYPSLIALLPSNTSLVAKLRKNSTKMTNLRRIIHEGKC